MRYRAASRVAASPTASSSIAAAVILSGQDGQVRTPRPDRVTVLLRHHTSDLRDVSQVVDDPCRQQLPEHDHSELRVLPRECEFGVGQSPASERREVRCTQPRKLVEEVVERFTLTLPKWREAVERHETDVR